MERRYKIALIPGDGIGHEVVPEGVRVLEEAGRKFGFSFDWEELPWSCEYYKKTGRMMPEDGLEHIRHKDAIYLGAVGYPGVPDHVSLWGLLIPIRQQFQQYVNLRPVRLMEGIKSPLAGVKPGDIDMLIVRENSEGEYSNAGTRTGEDTPEERITQESIFTRKGVDRIMHYAFQRARERRKHLTSATKSNGLTYTMPYWDKRFEAISKQYPDVKIDKYHIDILTALFVKDPSRFDVIVASNLFGDILSDLGPACAGTIAIAPGANLNPEKEYPSMFEPVHGSAPDIAGQGLANPIGQIWSGVLMLRHIGESAAAQAVMHSIHEVLINGPYTPDLGGHAKTHDIGTAIFELIS